MSKRLRSASILLFFLVAGLLHAYPDLRFIHESGSDFKGVALMGAADETVYVSRLAGVIYRGDLTLANVGVYEHRKDPPYLPFIAEDFEGLTARLFNVKPWQIDICFTFIAPLLICWLIYSLAYAFTGSGKLSVFCSLVVVLDYYWLTPNVKAIMSLSPDYFTNALFFSRPINPQLTFIPFIVSLCLAYRAFRSKSRILSIGAGAVLGLLCYVNFYLFAYVAAGLAVLLCVHMLMRDTQAVRALGIVSLVAFVIALGNVVHYAALKHNPVFLEVYLRNGGIFTRQPAFPVMDMASLAFISVLMYFLKERRRELCFMFSFVLGGIVCLNQQLLTGRLVQPAHWSYYSNKFFIIISLFTCVYFIVQRISSGGRLAPTIRFLGRRTVFYSACLMLFFPAFLQQNVYYDSVKKKFSDLQSIAPAVRFIHEKLPLDAVILTDPFRLDDERLISILSKNYPYISDTFLIASAVMTDKEIEERYFYALHFFGYSAEEARQLFRFMSGGLFRGMCVSVTCGATTLKNDEYIRGLEERYARTLTDDPVIGLKKFKADYVLTTQKDLSRLLKDQKVARLLEEVYSDGSYILFRLK